MLVSDIITLVRGMVKDSVVDSNGNYRWSDGDIIRYVNAAQQAVVNVRPEAQFVAQVGNPALTTVTSAGESLEVIPAYKMALAHHVAYSLLHEDSDDAANMKLAGEHYNLFKVELS